jgi:hypothetical protein
MRTTPLVLKNGEEWCSLRGLQLRKVSWFWILGVERVEI